MALAFRPLGVVSGIVRNDGYLWIDANSGRVAIDPTTQPLRLSALAGLVGRQIIVWEGQVSTSASASGETSETIRVDAYVATEGLF